MSDIQEEQKRLYKRAEENDYYNLLRKYNNLKTALDESQEVVISYKEENDRLNNIIDKVIEYIKENIESCRVKFNETQDTKWLDYIEIYGCIEYELKGDNK